MPQAQVVYLDEYKFSHRQKEEEITLDLNLLINWIVESSLLLNKEADPENVSACIKLFLESYKEKYKYINIKF